MNIMDVKSESLPCSIPFVKQEVLENDDFMEIDEHLSVQKIKFETEENDEWIAPRLEVIKSIKKEIQDPEDKLVAASSDDDDDSEFEAPIDLDDETSDSSCSESETQVKRRKTNNALYPLEKKEIYRCKFCTRNFRRKSNYKVHMRKRHKKSLDDIEKQEKRKPKLGITFRETNSRETDKVKSAFQNIVTGLLYPNKSINKITKVTDSSEESSEVDEDYRPKFTRKTVPNIANKCDDNNSFTIISSEENSIEIESHVEYNKVTKRHQCKVCKENFELESEFKAHFNQDHLEAFQSAAAIKTKEKQFRPYKCFHCQKTFIEQKHLTNHVNSRHKSFSQTLNSSSVVNPQKGSFVCTICDKTYSYLDSLVVHMRNHRQEKPFKCKFCSDRFIRRSYLTRHVRVHTKETPFLCSLCHQAFARRDGCNSHISRAHNGNAKVMKAKSTFNGARSKTLIDDRKKQLLWMQCNICKVFLKTEELMIEHIKKSHQKEENVSPVGEGQTFSVSENNPVNPPKVDEGNKSSSLLSTKVKLRSCSINIEKIKEVVGSELQKKMLNKTFLKIFNAVASDDVSETQSTTIPDIEQPESNSSVEHQLKLSKNSSYSTPADETSESSEFEYQTDDGKSPERITSEDENEMDLYKSFINPSQKIYYCNICGKNFKNLQFTIYKRHVRFHKTDTSLSCCICNKLMSTPEELVDHYAEHKKQSIEQQQTKLLPLSQSKIVYACHLCTKTFSKESSYNFHISSHEIPDPPSIIFTSKPDRTHAAKPKCKNKVKNLNSTNEDGLPCLICQLKFSSSHELIQHYRIHQNEKSSESSTVKLEENIESEEEKLEVIKIENVESVKDHYYDEMEMEITQETEKNTGQNPQSVSSSLENEILPTLSSSYKKIIQQQEDIHIPKVKKKFQLNKYTCSHCPESFSYSYHLSKHTRTYHGALADPEKQKSIFNNIISISQGIVNSKSSTSTEFNDKTLTSECSFQNCKLKFSTKELATKHSDSHRGVYKCTFCNSIFGYKDTLARHIDKFHPTTSSGPIVSEAENNSTVVSINIDSLLGLTPPPELKAPNFSNNNTVKDNAITFYSNVEDQTTFNCSICQKEFPTKLAAEIHKLTHTPLKSSSKPKVSLNPKFVIKQRDTTTVNVSNQLNKTKSTKKATTNTTDVNLHIQPPLKEPIFKCKFRGCSKTFLTMKSAEDHQKQSHQTKKMRFPCPLCTQSYSKSHYLTKHLASIHPGLSESTIQQISSACENGSSSTNHDISNKLCNTTNSVTTKSTSQHKSDEVYPKCHICGKLYGRWCEVYRHIRVIHSRYKETPIIEETSIYDGTEDRVSPINVVPQTDSTNFTCTIASCGEKFTNIRQALSHQLRCHSNGKKKGSNNIDTAHHIEKPLEIVQIDLVSNNEDIQIKEEKKKCCYCPMKFDSDSDLYEHMIVHSSLTYTCGNCTEVFSDSDQLLKHIQEKHGAQQGLYSVHFPNRKRPNQNFLTSLQSNKTRKKPARTTLGYTYKKRAVAFPCEYCQKKFKIRHKLINHINESHPGGVLPAEESDITEPNHSSILGI